MGFLDSIKETVNEYKRYKENGRNSKSLAKNGRSGGIINYLALKRFEQKYEETLYKHFQIPKGIKHYEQLINIFGKKNLTNVLNDSTITTCEMGDKLFEGLSSEEVRSRDEKFVIEMLEDSIAFNRATGMELSEINSGISPQYYKRKSLNNGNMIDVLKGNNITKDELQEIYQIYGQEIISSYNNDSYIRNKSVLKIHEEDSKKSSYTGELQDHVTYYSEGDFKAIFDKYFNGEEMSKTEQCILIGMLVKETELINMYTPKYLKENSEFIKAEMDIGIFDDMVISNKSYSNEDRKRLVSLKGTWKKDDLDRYNNLDLLKQRMLSATQTQENLQVIKKIEEIMKKPFEDIQNSASEIADVMNDIYMDYEVQNRSQIIENVYNPKDSKEIVITDFAQMGESAMLHFFAPSSRMSNFDAYVKRLEDQSSKSLGKKVVFSDEEKEAMKLQYQNKENHYITDYALDFEGIGQVDSFLQYATNTSEQLCTMITTPEKILLGKEIRGIVALGFSKQTLDPSLIATISNKNIHSNKGIDYVESDNTFKDFSASYDELIANDKKSGGNTELVLFRNSYEASLKPSYVMYIGNDKLDSANEQQNLNDIREQMKNAGLNVPLVIFDRYSIREKMNEAKKDVQEYTGEDR